MAGSTAMHVILSVVSIGPGNASEKARTRHRVREAASRIMTAPAEG